MRNGFRILVAAVAGVFAVSVASALALPTRAASTAKLAQSGFFFAGVTYVAAPEGGQVVSGQMYVEYYFPKVVTHPYPIVMITGGAGTGTNYTGTPDGRPGWANYFVDRGWKVYVTDQPARGRSAQFPDIVGKTVRATAESDMQRLTLTERYHLWPQADLHTQWPGTGARRGMPGDPAFDQFEAARVPFLANSATMELLNRQAVADLLDRIGPAVVQTHSQSGAYGWSIADARPAPRQRHPRRRTERSAVSRDAVCRSARVLRWRDSRSSVGHYQQRHRLRAGGRGCLGAYVRAGCPT